MVTDEAGMGFAVVAEEVRNLTQRSAQVAKDTTAIIELSFKGVLVARRVREVLTEITNQAGKVDDLMNEISAAGQEQAWGIEQVSKAMTQIETVTQQNAASAEESASASEELNAQADSMRKIVQELSELVHGAERIRQKNSTPVGHGVSSPNRNEDSIKFIILKTIIIQNISPGESRGFFHFNKRLLEEFQRIDAYYLLNLCGVQPVSFLKVRMKLV